MTDNELLEKLQSTINFYKDSLKDYEKALSYLKEGDKYYPIIIDKMLEASDEIDRCSRIIRKKTESL